MALISVEAAVAAIGENGALDVSLRARMPSRTAKTSRCAWSHTRSAGADQGPPLSVKPEAIQRISYQRFASYLLVYNLDIGIGVVHQVFLNRRFAVAVASGPQSAICTGNSVLVLSRIDRLHLQVKLPLGYNRTDVLVLPQRVKVEDLALRGLDMRKLADPRAVVGEPADKAVEMMPIGTALDRAVAVFDYEIKT